MKKLRLLVLLSLFLTVMADAANTYDIAMVKIFFFFHCAYVFAQRRAFVLLRLNTTYPRLNKNRMHNLCTSKLLMVFTVALLWMTFSASAQVNDTINGLVTDTQNSALDGGEVGLDGVAVKTKSDGRFQWVVPKSNVGKILLTFNKGGYEPQTLTVETGTPSSTVLQAQLASSGNPQDAYRLNPVVIESEVTLLMSLKWNDDFKHVSYPKQWLDKVFTVKPGGSIQSAIDSANSAGGGVVLLKEGTHTLDSSITLKSKVTITGEGRARTIIEQGSGFKGGTAFFAKPAPQVNDLVIKDLTLKGLQNNRAHGIQMWGKNESRHTRIMLQNITVSNWDAHGVHIKRTDNIIMDNCIFQSNGSAGSLFHNVYFLYNKYILQSDCDMSFPVTGKGNKYTSTEYVLAQRCTIKDSKVNGIQSDHEEAGYIFFHKYNISGCGRVALWFPCEHYYDKHNYTENPKYAPQKVILNRCAIVNNTWGAMWRAVNDSYVINCTFANKKIDMGLLKCDVTMENSTFTKGNQIYTDVDEWPSDVKLLW